MVASRCRHKSHSSSGLRGRLKKTTTAPFTETTTDQPFEFTYVCCRWSGRCCSHSGCSVAPERKQVVKSRRSSECVRPPASDHNFGKKCVQRSPSQGEHTPHLYESIYLTIINRRIDVPWPFAPLRTRRPTRNSTESWPEASGLHSRNPQ